MNWMVDLAFVYFSIKTLSGTLK